MEPNTELRAAREASPSPTFRGEPMSRAELADAVNAHLWTSTEHRYCLDAHTVARYERGAVRWPNLAYRSALRAVLGVATDADLGFVPTRRGSAHGCAPPSAKPASSPTTDADDAARADEEIEALDLARRAAASDVGDATLLRLERAVDDLASSYATSRPAELLHRTRQHLRYVGQLLEARKTLSEHRRLLVVGGWLSLLAGTLHVDLEQQGPALACLGTAESLAREGGHDEIRAWCLETEAWRVLTLGEYDRAAALARGAQQWAPKGSPVLIQATAQEGRAWARLRDERCTQRAVRRVNRMASPLSAPDRPEHHYRYDPAKAMSYTATTLSWVGDPAAADFAREVIASLTADGSPGRRPRRLAVARLDLALTLTGQDGVDEAVQCALDAVLSGHVAPSNRWRALEVVRAVERVGTRDARPLREAYQELVQQGTR